MYHHMGCDQRHIMVDRGLSLHRLIRLITLSLAAHGYLNFIGNEFGHPEWVDFPREGNNWSYHYARRRWSLRDDPELYYHKLAEFDRDMLSLIKDYGVLEQPWPYRLYAHRDNQVLAYKRNELVFIFNFSPTHSYTDYAVEIDEGEYSLVFDSDSWRYGGQQRIEPNQRYFSLSHKGKHAVQLYLPTRTALVLAPKSKTNGRGAGKG
jgi:1,4-alpha-glucan branching enzyme